MCRLSGVGRNEEEGKNYWIIKNSWSKTRGCQDYDKIAKNSIMPSNFPIKRL